MTQSFDLKNKKIWVAGHRGLLGSAIVKRLKYEGCSIISVLRNQVDLRRQSEVEKWLMEQRPDGVIIAAATVGGIHANASRPAEFLYDNIMIGANIINASYSTEVEKLLFLGSSCTYPAKAPQPINEESLLTGPLEPTNEWYAIAKISGVKLCEAYRRQFGCNFISAMPTNLYGPGDNFDPNASHVIPALLRKAHEARTKGSPALEIWGSGSPIREFLHTDDCADALIYLLKNYNAEKHINVGSGEEVSIRQLADIIIGIVGFSGELRFDLDKPDGMPRKLLDSNQLKLMGWKPKIGLKEGITKTYEWSLQNNML